MMTARQAIGVWMTSDNKIYVVSTESNRIKVSGIILNNDLTLNSLIYYKSYGAVVLPLFGSSAAKLITDDYAYFAGNYNGNLGFTKYSLINGSPNYSYLIQNSNGHQSQKISQLAKYVSTILNSITIFGCADYLGVDGFDIGFLQILETSVTTNLIKSWLLDMDVQSKCLDVEIDSQYSYILLYKENSVVLQGKITLLDSITVINFNEIRLSTTLTQSLYPKIGYISGSLYFFGGQISQINSNNYSKKQSFIHRYPTDQDCIDQDVINTSVNVDLQTSFTFQAGIGVPKIYNPTIQTISPSDDSVIYQELIGLISQDLKSINLQQLPQSCLQLEPFGAISTPTVFTGNLSDQNYTANSTNSQANNQTNVTNQTSTNNQTQQNNTQNQGQNSTSNQTGLENTNQNQTNQTTTNNTSSGANLTNTTEALNNNQTSDSFIGIPLLFFETPLQDNFSISVGSNLTYQFPKINNILNLIHSFSVSELFLNETLEMVSFNETHIQINPQLTDQGLYYLIIKIQYLDNSNISQSEQYMINLKISKKPNIRGIEPQIILIKNNSTNGNQTDLDLSIKIQSISIHQELSLQFSKSIIVSDQLIKQIYDNYWKFISGCSYRQQFIVLMELDKYLIADHSYSSFYNLVYDQYLDFSLSTL
ncbi:UNKNOWN [Stylonychia lemnae]|uniref:Uncharacterized protein n=1 Tax=Stylonychia lemnae TaxID=5949 RepID=A0A077ZNN5_STYLE|nr:UNKNOWN [Stylonychia lemnae]|eukprot:CDW71089.1 UNKNOWN [Stylonychia lemnae]